VVAVISIQEGRVPSEAAENPDATNPLIFTSFATKKTPPMFRFSVSCRTNTSENIPMAEQKKPRGKFSSNTNKTASDHKSPHQTNATGVNENERAVGGSRVSTLSAIDQLTFSQSSFINRVASFISRSIFTSDLDHDQQREARSLESAQIGGLDCLSGDEWRIF
jgi:hypothetical protein